MKKNTSVFFIVILLLTQFIYPFQVVQAVADNSKLSIKMVDEGSGLFNMVINKSNDYDEVRINIPDKTEYELFDLEHNVENKNVISIDRKYILKNIIPIQLFNWNNEGNQISFGIYKNQQLIEEVSYGSPYQKGINKLNEVLEQEFIENITVYEQNNHSASAPEFQRLISVSPLFESVESGNDALYRVILKTTGSQVNYTNVQLVIKLPTNQLINFQQDYKELSIADVIPVYDEENNNLVYNFAELKSGQTYETIVKLGTTNGYIKNNTPLKLVANLKFLDNDVLDLSSEAEVIIKSSSAVNITKVFLSSSLNGKPSLPTLKSDVTWKIKANIPHKKTGQMFIQTGKKIIIKDILPNGLKFVKATNNGKDLVTKINNNILVWEFDSPGFNEQESNKDSLFQTEIIVHTKIKDDDNLIDKTLENKANLDTTFIDGSTLTSLPETSTSIKVYKTTGNTATISGSIVIPAHAGPLNDRGGFANQEELNPNITVDDSAYLGFRHGVRATYFGVEQDLNKLDIIYTIDEHLYLDKMILPSEDTWFFGRTAKEGQENKPLLKNPSYKLKLSFVRDGKLDTIIIQNAKTNVLLGLEELGLKKGDRVTEVRYIFDNPIPMGFANKFMSRYFFTIEPGYVGEIKNQFNMIGESSFNPKNYTYGDKNTIPFNYREDMKETAKEIAGDRTVWVEKKNNNGVPLAKIYVELDDHNNGAVSIGRNKLRVTYSSPSSSTDPISESIESVILLPPGVTISDEKYPVFYDDLGQRISGKFEIIDKNYNNTNRQLVKFKWDEKYIRPSQKLSAEVDVDISLKAPSSLYFDVYGFSGDTKLKVPQVNNSSLTDTILQTDLDDLNQDGKKDTPRIKSSNVYTILNAYDLKTEKFVKGPGEDWSKFAKTTPGGDIDYRLFLTNSTGKDISSMTLIDVLPANGDLGITDNIARGSKFMPYLKGPIKLPTEWQGKVTVFYSTAKNPKRDDLIRETNYPAGTQQLGNPADATEPQWMHESAVKDWTTIRSFKIELIPGAVWIKGVDMNITFSMEAPTVVRASDKGIFDPSVNPIERAAWNSFAVATDKGQPVEPQQVGVYIDEHIGELSLKKIDAETGKMLPGAEFEIRNEDGTFIKKIISNEEGKADLKQIPLGKYMIKEVNAPNGYNLSSDTFKFEVTNDKYQHEFTIKNQKIKGKVTIKKVDSITKKTLSDAVFEIKDSTGKVLQTVTTDKDGVASLDNLSDGTFFVTEVKAPEGYNLLQQPVKFDITSDNYDIMLMITNTKTGWELPDTGGSGILLSSVVGLMFMSVGFSLIRVRKV